LEEKMSDMKQLDKKSQEEEKGASLVEYALLVALIAVVCIVAVRVLGQKASQKFSTTSSVM
jgi:pilus assembly protein Flp/PilA